MSKIEIENYIKEIIEECRNVNIPVSNRINPEVVINRRARSRFAACKRESIFAMVDYTIEIGEALLKADEESVKNILAHEILHTCSGCYNHGELWKQYAAKMNREYGYRIKTTATYEELGLEAPEKKKKINYIITCQKCGNVIYRQKKSKLITHTSLYRCRCGGKLVCEKADYPIN